MSSIGNKLTFLVVILSPPFYLVVCGVDSQSSRSMMGGGRT